MESTASNERGGRRSAESMAEGLEERVLSFCGLLRRTGLTVTPGRIIDVFRSIRGLDLLQPDELRLALRTNLASSREQERIVDRMFDAFWRGRTALEEVPTELDLEPRPDDRNREYPETPPDLQGSVMQYSGEEAERDVNLAGRWQPESAEVERLVRDLAQKLATRPSRRRRPSRRGRIVDLRRSLRRNLRHGMDLVELRRSQRRVRKTRLVLICDVSGSMDTYNPFLLQLLLGLQKVLKNTRTVVFSTQATEITSTLRRRSVAETLGEITRAVRHWSGGTSIGRALASTNRRVMREGSARSTVAIVLSDGYDQGDPGQVKREMRALRRRVRSVVWVNPLLGTHGYAPLAKGMSAALPFVDHFLPAHDLRSLRALCHDLARV